MRAFTRSWGALLCALFLFGCANRGLTRYDAITKQASSQDYLDAVKLLKKERSKLYGSQSSLLYDLDVGLLYHYASAYDSSIVYLTRAVDLHEDLFAKSVTNEAASLLV